MKVVYSIQRDAYIEHPGGSIDVSREAFMKLAVLGPDGYWEIPCTPGIKSDAELHQALAKAENDD